MSEASRVALVTGGNRGIGFEICRQLARCGLSIVLTARDAGEGKAAARKLQDEGLGVDFQLLVFGVLTAVWAGWRFRAGLRTTGLTALVATAALAVLDALWGPAVCLLLLLLWVLDDVADWYCDRLVVTDKRIYRRYGVVTQHSPSISLTAIAYLDASVPPLGHLLGYGTLSLDSVAQRDAPLSRFDHVPDVVPASHSILELRSRAMPKFPQQPL